MRLLFLRLRMGWLNCWYAARSHGGMFVQWGGDTTSANWRWFVTGNALWYWLQPDYQRIKEYKR